MAYGLKWKVAKALGFVLMWVLICGGWYSYVYYGSKRDQQIRQERVTEENVHKIKHGMSPAEVTAILGPPTSSETHEIDRDLIDQVSLFPRRALAPRKGPRFVLITESKWLVQRQDQGENAADIEVTVIFNQDNEVSEIETKGFPSSKPTQSARDSTQKEGSSKDR
jgi:outer membrane protein assembly factor BamE (lipoprotein component of BamABCDE complex)